MIKLTRDKIFYICEYNKEEEKKEVGSLIDYLNQTLEIEEEVTLGDIFDFIEKEKNAFSFVFGSSLGHYSLDSFIEDINREWDGINDLDYIDFRWYMDQYGETAEDNDIQIFINVIAIGDAELGQEENADEYGKIEYAFDFMPLWKMRTVPVVLNKKFQIYEMGKFGPGKDDKNVVVEGLHDFSVYEFFDALFNEISFYGDPEEREALLEKIDKDAKEMNDSIENGDDSKFISWDDAKKMLEEGDGDDDEEEEN